MAKILGLGGLFFKSENPEVLAKWYQRWLGMELAFPYGVSFASKDIPANGHQVWSPFKSDTQYFQPSDKAFMFNLMVDDLDAMLAKLAPSGCVIMPEREKSEYGDFGWFIDPEGNKVELWQPPATSPPA